jgi:hypothetical protein
MTRVLTGARPDALTRLEADQAAFGTRARPIH